MLNILVILFNKIETYLKTNSFEKIKQFTQH